MIAQTYERLCFSWEFPVSLRALHCLDISLTNHQTWARSGHARSNSSASRPSGIKSCSARSTRSVPGGQWRVVGVQPARRHLGPVGPLDGRSPPDRPEAVGCLRYSVVAVPRGGRRRNAHRLAGRIRKAVEVDVSDPGEGDGSLGFAIRFPCAVLAGQRSVGSWLQRDDRPVFDGEFAAEQPETE
jgi:hypothetical protein